MIIISVCSLKGGTGKSTVVANLAKAFESLKKKTLVFDADFGANNADLYLNVDGEYDITDFLSGATDMVSIISNVSPYLGVISGNTGTVETADLPRETVKKIINELIATSSALRYDAVIIDTAPSLHHSTMMFCESSDIVIVVTNTDPPSMVDNYQFIKNMVLDGFDGSKIFLLVNRVNSQNAALITYSTISSVLADNVDTGSYNKIRYIGYIEDSKSFAKSMSKKRTAFDDNPHIAKRFIEIASLILRQEYGER